VQTHYFIAVPLPSSVKATLAKWRQQSERMLPFQSWVHQEDYHITLAFLGSTASHVLSSLKQEMEQLLSVDTFSLTAEGLYTFGVSERPRILWAGVTQQPELFAVQRQVQQSCKTLGLSLDDRPYRPHITLARRWRGDDAFDQTELKEWEPVSFLVEKISLYQTHLNRAPKYEEIHSVFLSKV
jgi:2'-5' RNA ligase